jgi:hypothetical protein
MRKLFAVFAVATLVTGAAAAAGPRCFKPAEIEAEQAMLFQTELMVVAEACRDPAYVSFLTRNRDTVVFYQKQLVEHFRRHGERRAEIALDSYLTRLANESSLRNGRVPVTVVCNQGATLLRTANALGPRDFRNYAAEKATLNRSYYRACN